jgi:hypothetical protein
MSETFAYQDNPVDDEVKKDKKSLKHCPYEK